MRLTRLLLTDFRNYEDLALTPAPGLNLLVGENAQGKTNLLEAILVCCVGRGHRTGHDRDLVRQGQESAYILADCEKADGLHRVEIGLSLSGRKSVRLNGSAAQRLGELMGHMRAVMFSPEEIQLVKGGPSGRRRFMDMALSQMQPAYFFALQQYQQALAQRNALLKELAMGRPGGDMLLIWEKLLAQAGAVVAAARADFCTQLARDAGDSHAVLTEGKETLTVRYETSLTRGEQPTEETLAALLAESRDADIRRGVTGVGPHRDDLLLLINGQDARLYASQGQQRTAALALKLAEFSIMSRQTGETPLLLLDDVLSELDPRRRRMLLAHIDGVQVFLTCVEGEQPALPAGLRPRVYRVRRGRIHPE